MNSPRVADGRSVGKLGVHLFMLAACALLLCVAIVSFVENPVTGWETIAVASLVMLPVSAVPALLWHDCKKYERRDAALTLPWTFILIALIPAIAVLSAHLQFPLRDGWLVKLDDAMGFHVPTIIGWSHAYWPIGWVLDRSYPLLSLLLPVAVLLPAILGKREAAERFLLANTAAFIFSFPIFTLVPAVGPWAGYQFAGSQAQISCEAAIVALHNGSDTAAMASLVTFPSFHVIWAMLSACALWSIKPLRIPSTILASLIVISTVTSGWHYVADIIAGFMIVGISLCCANWIMGVNKTEQSRTQDSKIRRNRDIIKTPARETGQALQ
jgi:hypothetical protein